MTFRVPVELDLIDVLDAPDRDYGAYFLDTLLRKRVTWDVDARGYSRLQRSIVTRFIPERRFTGIRGALEAQQVIHVDRSYRAGERSIGYRLEPWYWPSRSIECRNKALIRRIQERQAVREKRLLPVHRWLHSKFGILDFDHGLAAEIISTMLPEDGSLITVHDYRVLLREICHRFRRRGAPFFEVDAFGRVHTPITNLPAELRPCLSVNGQKLVGLDLTSSQPLICGILAQRFAESPVLRSRMLNRRFDGRTEPYVWREVAATRRKGGVGGSHLRAASHRALASPNMCCARHENPVKTGTFSNRQVKSSAPADDLDRYLRLCEEGRLYEHLMEPGEDRSRLKVRLFADVFFGKPCYRSRLKQRFEREFPTIAGMLQSLKQRDYRQVAWLMQSYESTLFIAIICRRLMNEKPQLPIFTIHDSILTVPDGVEDVRHVILEEFAKLGIVPTLKEECYASGP